MSFNSNDNTYAPVGINKDKLIVLDTNPSTDNISLHSSNNNIVDIINIKTLLNKDTNKELHLSAFDGSTINPLIKINNTHQHVNITSNLNVSSNLNIDNLTITHNSISTNANPYEIAFLDNSLIDIGYIKTTDAQISNVSINGGFINNTIIGNVTPNTGKFTTLNTTSNATIDGTLSINDTITFSNTNSKNFVINKDNTRKAHITTDGFAKFDKLKISIDDAAIGSHTSDLWIYNNSSNDSLLKLETAGSDKKNVITFQKPNNSATITYDTDNILKIVNNESSYGAIRIGNENNQSLFQNNNDGFTTFKRNANEKLIINKDYVEVKGKFYNSYDNVRRQTEFEQYSTNNDNIYITSGTGWPGFDTSEHTPICEFKSDNNGRVVIHATAGNSQLHVDGSINATKLSIRDDSSVEKAYINNNGHLGCESLSITGSAQHGANPPVIANIKTLSLNVDTSLHLRSSTDKNHRLEFVSTADIPWNGATSTDTGYIGNRTVDGFRLIGNLGGVIGKRKASSTINGVLSSYHGPNQDEIIMWLHDNIDLFKPVICKTNLTVDAQFKTTHNSVRRQYSEGNYHASNLDDVSIKTGEGWGGHNSTEHTPLCEFKSSFYSRITMHGTGAGNNCDLHIDGNVFASGGGQLSSDDRFKTNEIPLTNCLQTITKLQPEFYTKTNLKNMTRNIGECPTYVDDNGVTQQDIDNWPKEHYTIKKSSFLESGLIAQDTYNNVPELRHLISITDDALNNPENFTEDNKLIENVVDSNGIPSYLGINYGGIIPYLIGAVKEMSAKINSLETELNNLKSQ